MVLIRYNDKVYKAYKGQCPVEYEVGSAIERDFLTISANLHSAGLILNSNIMGPCTFAKPLVGLSGLGLVDALASETKRVDTFLPKEALIEALVRRDQLVSLPAHYGYGGGIITSGKAHDSVLIKLPHKCAMYMQVNTTTKRTAKYLGSHFFEKYTNDSESTYITRPLYIKTSDIDHWSPNLLRASTLNLQSSALLSSISFNKNNWLVSLKASGEVIYTPIWAQTWEPTSCVFNRLNANEYFTPFKNESSFEALTYLAMRNTGDVIVGGESRDGTFRVGGIVTDRLSTDFNLHKFFKDISLDIEPLE